MSLTTIILLEMRLKIYSTDPVTEQTIRFTNAPYDLSYNGYTFTAAGDLLGIGEFERSYELLNDGLELTLSGINPVWQSIVSRDGFRGAPIDIWLAQVPEGSNQVSAAVFYHRGFAGNPVIELDQGTNTITIKQQTTSVFKDLDLNNVLMSTSLAHHQALHPSASNGFDDDDLFFEFTADSEGLGDETWKT